MIQTVATNNAVRVMGVWVRRADAVIANGGIANAARAVEAERRRVLEHERELALLELGERPLTLAG